MTGASAHLSGSGGAVGGSYTLDVLPASCAGEYVLCPSGGLQGEWWRVSGMSARGMTLPLWLSFGAPLRLGVMGIFPHASFGGYARLVTGEVPSGALRSRDLRPWGDAGLLLGPAAVDASIRHEFRTRERAVLTFSVPF